MWTHDYNSRTQEVETEDQEVETTLSYRVSSEMALGVMRSAPPQSKTNVYSILSIAMLTHSDQKQLWVWGRDLFGLQFQVTVQL